MRSGYSNSKNEKAGRIGKYPKTNKHSSTQMALSSIEAIQFIKAQVGRNWIQKAIYNEERVQFHSKAIFTSKEANSYYKEYIEWVASLLPKDKSDAFQALLTFPLKTTSLLKKVRAEYEKAFNSNDKFFDINFSDDKLKEDANKFLSEEEFEVKFNELALKLMFEGCNSLIAIDLPTEQLSTLPEPYFYSIPITDLESVVTDQDGDVLQIAFRRNGYVIYADETSYYMYLKKDDNYTLISTSIHLAPMCPVNWFWSDKLTNDNHIVKDTPLSLVVGELDDYLFQYNNKKALDLASGYPIYWTEEITCTYEDPESKKTCCNGKVQRVTGVVYQCPMCEANRLLGAGSVIQKPTPLPGMPEMGEPIGIVGVSKESLDHNTNETIRLEKELFEKLTGKSSDDSSKYALNEIQVKSNFESQTNIINAIARSIEIAYKFIIDVSLSIRYGESFISSEVNFGYEHYLQTIADVTNDYKVAKESGVPAYILADKRAKIEGILSKSDSKKRNRFNILKALDPFPDYTLDELTKIKFQIPEDLLYKKMQFSYLVSKFESEYSAVEDFLPNASLNVRLKFINNNINAYVKQEIGTNTGGSSNQATTSQSAAIA